jgi:hypothetical protein
MCQAHAEVIRILVMASQPGDVNGSGKSFGVIRTVVEPDQAGVSDTYMYF